MRTVTITPKILYFGTPVVLVSSSNPDTTPNLAPMSSAWALGMTVVLGLTRTGQTLANIERTGECVLSLPSDDLWEAVERLAPLTGRNPPPERVAAYGGRFEQDKFGAAGLTPIPAECVSPPRVAECPLQLEAVVQRTTPLIDDDSLTAVETRVVRVHAHPDIMADAASHVDPARWHPLVYNFRHYFGLGPELGRTFRATTPQAANEGRQHHRHHHRQPHHQVLGRDAIPGVLRHAHPGHDSAS
jgi:flavin reductase (DIM6/NTAB) family NADH-FMN oxidoreductase RutF